MTNNMDDLFANVKKMVDSGNIPDDIKQMMNNMSKSNSSTTEPNSNNILDQISPEMINNLSNMLNSSNQTSKSENFNFGSSGSSTNNTSNNFNLDMNTIMKMKSIMENMNNKNDPRANLLYSLKPYLRDSKKDKLDQYVNLLNVSKIAELMNKNNNNEEKK